MDRQYFNIYDISATLIKFANEKNKKITNLHLQKLLYFIQLEYIKKYDDLLFEEEFQAWTYGPVNYNLWKEYSQYSRSNIINANVGNEIFDEKVKFILEKRIINYLRKSIWELVDILHEQQPWKDAYENNQKVISNENIIKYVRR